MKAKINTEELYPLTEFINEGSSGNLLDISNDLHKAIYYLHYLTEDDIQRIELQDICFTLYHISQGLYQTHTEKQESIT